MDITSDYGAMTRMLGPEHLPRPDENVQQLADHLMRLASRMRPEQLVTSKRKPKVKQAKGYVDAAVARSHVSIARVLKMTAAERP